MLVGVAAAPAADAGSARRDRAGAGRCRAGRRGRRARAGRAAGQPSAGAAARDRRVSDRRGGQVLRVPVPRLNESRAGGLRAGHQPLDLRTAPPALIEQVEELKLATARLRKVTHQLESDYEVRAFAGNTPPPGPSAPPRRPAATASTSSSSTATPSSTCSPASSPRRRATSPRSARASAGTIREFDGDLAGRAG